MRQKNKYSEFSTMSKDEQRDEILRITALCVDGAPVGLARKIEIYLGETEESALDRQRCVCDSFSWQHFDGTEKYIPADAILSHPYRHKE